jgi:hypothetical protein
MNVTRNITSHSSWNTKLWNLYHAISSSSGVVGDGGCFVVDGGWKCHWRWWSAVEKMNN